MKRVRSLAIVPVVALSISLAAARAESESDAKAAKYFEVKWSRITYDKTDYLENRPSVEGKQQTSESLSLSCEVIVRDPNLVLGTLHEGVITQLTGRKGQEVAILPSPSYPGYYYERPRYQQKYTQPPAVPRWKAILQSVLRLKPNTAFTPKLVWELQTSPLNLRLDARALDQAGGQLRRVQGYLPALVAESLENVDVPFEPNDQWVRLTPTQEIQVRQASCTGRSYQLQIEARPPGGGSRPLRPGDPLPQRLVVAQQILGPDGKPLDPFRGGPPWLPIPVGGGMGGSLSTLSGRTSDGVSGGVSGGTAGGASRSATADGADSPIRGIRFVIAVNPTHCRIPFDLQRIPLPDPNQPPPRHQKGS